MNRVTSKLRSAAPFTTTTTTTRRGRPHAPLWFQHRCHVFWCGQPTPVGCSSRWKSITATFSTESTTVATTMISALDTTTATADNEEEEGENSGLVEQDLLHRPKDDDDNNNNNNNSSPQHHVLYEAEQKCQQISNLQEKREMAEQILDSWLAYQDELLEAYYHHGGLEDHDENRNDGRKTRDWNHQKRSQLKRICEAAERSHLLLQVMLPFLARNKNNNNSIQQPYATFFAKTQTTTTARHGAKGLSSSNIDNDNGTQLASNLLLRRKFNVAATARCDAVLLAYTKAARAGQALKQTRLTRAIPQRAQSLLEQMEASFSSNSNSSSSVVMGAEQVNDSTRDEKMIVVRPSVESYNRVMEAWAYSHEHLRGSMAERIFQKLLLSAGTTSGSRPNGESFRLIITAWAWSGERRAAFTATGHLMKMLRRLETGNEDMEPSLDDYKVIFKAWTKAEDKLSPGKAMSVLRLMDDAFRKGLTTVEPDFACFRYLLLVAANRPLVPDLGSHVDDVLARMSARLFIPDTECYEAAIETWKNTALNPESEVFRDHSVKRVLELLSDMRVASQQSSSVLVKPTTKTINNVIETLSISSNPRRMDQAEHLLLEMEEALDENRDDAVPSANSYKQVINIWMGSKLPEKVPRAKSVLWRMEERYEKLFQHSNTVDDFVGIFNAFIRVCASVDTQNAEKQKEILKEALASIEAMKPYANLRPNADTFTAILEACDNLLAPGSERALIIEKVFRLCCEKGMVDDNVLVRLRSAVSADHYYKLVVSASEEVEGQRMVPEPWTYNALGGRVITADGRRTKPLSIEGKLAVTKSMLDFRMRRLTDKRNRNLLRGARLGRPSVTGAGTLTANES